MDEIDPLGLPESRWVDVDGPVHYRQWDGPSGGATFVCVHGLGGSLLNWAPVAPGLARYGTVVALDIGGFGLTPVRAGSAGVGSNWRLLDGFLRALDLAPAILVGNSMGGMIVLIQAAHAPATVRSLVLVDAAFPRPRAVRGQFDPRVAAAFALYSNRRLGARLAEIRARRLGPEGLVRETLRLAAADPSTIDPALVEAMVEQTRRRMELDYSTPAFLTAARSIFRAQVRPGKFRALVRAVRAPALVVHGGKDGLVPVGAARAAVRDHPNWDLVVFDDLGHVPQMESPARWLHAVEAWLAGGTAESAGHAG